MAIFLSEGKNERIHVLYYLKVEEKKKSKGKPFNWGGEKTIEKILRKIGSPGKGKEI